MIQFILPLEGGKLPMTLNTQGNMHYRQVSAIKKQTEIDVSNVCAEKGVPYIAYIEEVLFTLVVGDARMRDADNMAPLAKATLDALKKTGIIDEDHYKLVNRVSYNIHHESSVKVNYALITIWGRASEDDERNGQHLPEILVTEADYVTPKQGRPMPPVVVPEDAKIALKDREGAKSTTSKKKAPAKKAVGTSPRRKGRVITID